MRQLDWGTPEQEEKLAFISYFHDIVLPNDKLARIHSKEEMRAANLSPQEKALVEKHAQMAGEIVHRFPKLPMGVDAIIKQHHGQLNGIGFSDHYGANISPVAIVFILSEEVTRLMIDNENEFNLFSAVKVLRRKFHTTRFKKIIDAIEKIPI
jgi:uncharacterized spore protein YtfJ